MLNKFGTRKGQYFSFDAIIAAVIFVLTLIMLLSYWYSVRSYLDFQANDLNKEATRLSNLLVLPASGDCNSLTRLGLANSFSDKRMNISLLNCLNEKMSAAQVRSNLSSSYDVSIVVTDTYENEEYIFGPDPTKKSFTGKHKEVSKFRRVGTIADVPTKTGLEDHMATIDLYIYR
jgi:hypothetical protein